MSQPKPTARKIQFQPRFVQQIPTTMVNDLKPKKFVGLLTPRATLKVNAAVFYHSEPQNMPVSARTTTGGGQDPQDSSQTKQRQMSGMHYKRHRLLLKEKQTKQITQPLQQPQTQTTILAQRNQESQNSARHRLQAISNDSSSQRNSSTDTSKQTSQWKVINKKLISFSGKKEPLPSQRTKQPLIHLGYRRQMVEAPVIDEEFATERQAPQLTQIFYQQDQQKPITTSRRQATTSSIKKSETSVSSATKRRPLIIRKNNFLSQNNASDEVDRSLNRTLKVSNLQNSFQKSIDTKLSTTNLQQSQSIKLVAHKNSLNSLSSSAKDEVNDLPLSAAESVPVFEKVIEEISLKQLKDSKSTENQLKSASSLKQITMRGQILRKQQKDSKENLLRTTNGMLFQDNSCQQLFQPAPESLVSQSRGIVKKKSSDDQVEIASPGTQSKPKTRGEQSTTERTYCNSSVKENGNRNLGTVFSFKSQIMQQKEIPQFPMAPLDTIRHYGKMLTEFERTEILEYPDVYFIGKQGISKIQGSPHLEFNFGYDDDQGDYKYIENDHIGYRYEVLKFLGKGSFGTALKCIDHKNGTEIALKVVKNKQKYVYQAGVELKILQFLKENDPEDIMNVVHLEDYVVFRKHLCISFELLSMNLFEFLKINDFNGFDHNLIRRFAIQLLYALKYLKMFQIIHCDLKPENIMLKENNKSGIKMIDFGSSTFQDERMYTYIQSRFYRAPEIMLGIPYDCGIDMWSFGCICAELYIGYPIFPGESEQDQMCRIMEMIGVPSNDVLAISERKSRFFKYNESSRQLDPIMFKNSRGKLRKVHGKPLELLMGNEDPDFTDFVQKCLIMDPRKRMTPNKALKHVWVLKGLPPQVLIHHQKMHNIPTPELPASVLKMRSQYLKEQEQMKSSRVPQPSKDLLQAKPQQTQLNSARNQKTAALLIKK